MAGRDQGGRSGVDDERRLLGELTSPEALLDALLPAPAGVYVKDRAGRYLWISATGAAGLGYAPEDLVGKTDSEVFPGELGERMELSDQDIMAAGEPRTVEEPVMVSGRLRTYLSTKAPLRDPAGTVIGLVGASTDVTSLREADEEVRRREAQLAEAQALTRIGSWEWEVNTGEHSWSDETFRIVGLDRAGVEPTVEVFLECVHPDDRQRMADKVQGSLVPESGRIFELEHRIIHPDGEERICSCRGRVFFDLDGTPLRMVGAVQDITEQRRAEEDLAARELQLRTAQELTGVGSWDWDPATNRVTWSSSLYPIFGLRPGEFEGTVDAYLDRVHPDDRSAQQQRIERALDGADPDFAEARIVRPDGEIRLLRSSMRLVRSSEGEPLRLIGACEDITGRAPDPELIERLHALAHTDDLTGLWNRRAWDEQLSRELARASREGGRLCVAMLDLDAFKGYNDSHGHQAGDELLRTVANSWRDELRATDVLARYGGEEFAVALPAAPIDAAHRVVERLRLDIPAGQTCSAGLVAWDGEESAQELVGRADAALYEAKRAGRNHTVVRP